jgi:hypothetical protein
VLTTNKLTTVFHSKTHKQIKSFQTKGDLAVDISIDYIITMSTGEYNVIQLNETPFTAGIKGK